MKYSYKLCYAFQLLGEDKIRMFNSSDYALTTPTLKLAKAQLKEQQMHQERISPNGSDILWLAEVMERK